MVKTTTLFQLLLICLQQSKNIPIKGLTNTSFRKNRYTGMSTRHGIYVGTAPRFPPEITPLLTSMIDSPTLVVEVAASSLSDDIGRKQLLYERLGVKEYG